MAYRLSLLQVPHKLNKPVEHSPREATSNSAGRHTRRPLCNRKVHYRFACGPCTRKMIAAHLAIPYLFRGGILPYTNGCSEYIMQLDETVCIRRVTYWCNEGSSPSDARYIYIITVIPRITKIIRSGITFVS